MNPESDPRTQRDAEAFDLLERPEDWPEDPELQAELAAMLECHLALSAHAPGMGLGVQEAPAIPSAPIPLVRRFPWLMSAAAVLLVAVPVAYHVQNARAMAEAARNQARIQGMALRRGQERLWAGFFQQSSSLIQDFSRHSEACGQEPENEDRSAEREVAFALLQASHKLAAQGAPGPQAEGLREDLHAWLMELSLEDGCMEPQRAKELRQWASTHNLEDEAQRMGRQLQGGNS